MYLEVQMRKKFIFSEEEFQQRVRKTKEMMDKAGMEMLLVMDPANMNYLTGYDGWSFYVHQGVVVSLDAPYPFWFGRESGLKPMDLNAVSPYL